MFGWKNVEGITGEQVLKVEVTLLICVLNVHRTDEGRERFKGLMVCAGTIEKSA